VEEQVLVMSVQINVVTKLSGVHFDGFRMPGVFRAPALYPMAKTSIRMPIVFASNSLEEAFGVGCFTAPFAWAGPGLFERCRAAGMTKEDAYGPSAGFTPTGSRQVERRHFELQGLMY
jgi:hypothetical protein